MNRVVIEARTWIGTPYVHGASVKRAGTDCLGLIRGVWRSCVGAEPEAPPSYTPDWGEVGGIEVLDAAARRHMRSVDLAQSRPGDVLLFRMRDAAVAKHLGILSAVGSEAAFIHAYDRHGVVESPLSEPWRAKVAGCFRLPL